MDRVKGPKRAVKYEVCVIVDACLTPRRIAEAIKEAIKTRCKRVDAVTVEMVENHSSIMPPGDTEAEA